MITFIRGILQDNLSSQVTVDVNGVGYEIHMPLSSLDKLGRPGDKVTVLTYLHIREQAHTLFGFMSPEERDLFRLLIDRVSGVGPKVAMAIIGGMDVPSFKSAVVQNDIAMISKIKGVGKKTAERIVLELKDKVGVAAAWEAASSSAPSAEHIAKTDAVLALISLGYKQSEAAKAVTDAAKAQGDKDLSVEDLVRTALRNLQ